MIQYQIGPIEATQRAIIKEVKSRLFPPQRAPRAREEPKAEPITPKKNKLPREASYRAVANLLRQGVIQERIYEMTGVSRKKIRKVALSLGIRTDNRASCEKHADEIKRMFDEGKSLISISLHFGMAKNSAANFARKKGWTR